MRHIVLATTLLLGGCSGGADLAAAEKAIARFHAELNAGQFARIQAESAPDWKKVSSPADTVQLFTGVHGKLGSFVYGKQTGWRVNYGTAGTLVQVQYDSKFQKAAAVETFVFRRTTNGAELIGYNINSRALITG